MELYVTGEFFNGLFGAATGSPYIIFVLTFCCMALCYASGGTYISIYTPLPWLLHENILHKQASRDITGAKNHIYAWGS